MKWLKRILAALVLLLALALALPFFISLNDYIPQIEKEASLRLKEPVSIKNIRFGAFPLPHITIEDIRIGTADDIRLGKVRLTPDLFSLTQSPIVIKMIEVDSLSMTQQAIARIPSWGKTDAVNQPPQIRVESIHFKNAQVTFGKAIFGPFDARVSLDGNSEPKDASIATQDGKLKVLIKSGTQGYQIDASAKSWILPVGPALVFDELIIKGTATNEDARLGEVSAKLYGGTAIGKMTFNWKKGMRLNGNLGINHLEVLKVASILSPGTHVSGLLNAKPVFSASSASADHFVSALRLETPFSIKDGVLGGIDIKKAATNLSKKGATGGETHFEQLSGNLVMNHETFHFTELKITSGGLAVDGNVDVSSKKELSGRINAQVDVLGASTKVALNVSGSIDSPFLFPTGGTMTGAAIGTVILGPGLGTSVGAKVGGWLEGVLGKKKVKKEPKK